MSTPLLDQGPYTVILGHVQSPVRAGWPPHYILVIRDSKRKIVQDTTPLFSIDAIADKLREAIEAGYIDRDQATVLLSLFPIPARLTRFDKIARAFGYNRDALIERFAGLLSEEEKAETSPPRFSFYPQDEDGILLTVPGFTYPPYGMISLGFPLNSRLNPMVFSRAGALLSLKECHEAGLLSDQEEERLRAEIMAAALTVTDGLTQADRIARHYPNKSTYWYYVLGAVAPQKPARFDWVNDNRAVQLFAFDDVRIGNHPSPSQSAAHTLLTNAVEEGLLSPEQRDDLVDQLAATDLPFETPKGGIDAALH